jgi:hypothetical protein
MTPNTPLEELIENAQPTKEEREFKDKVIQIMRDQITFSGQLHDYVVHGALESIWRLHYSRTEEIAIGFSKWVIDNLWEPFNGKWINENGVTKTDRELFKDYIESLKP